MGCSSGKLRNAGEYDPTGIAINYLLAGAPGMRVYVHVLIPLAVVANLWDVTDGDIDRYFLELLEVFFACLLGQQCRTGEEPAACVRPS